MKTPLLSLVVACLTVAVCGASDRVALIIGNNDYTHASKLFNPVNDAAALESALKQSGYRVTKVLNADGRAMDLALQSFCERNQGAESALFFFAGHGMEIDGVNYLIPTDAELRERSDLRRETLPLETVLKDLSAAQIRLKMVVLDCCRNNPFNTSTRSWLRTRGGGGGLAEVKEEELAEGTMLVFAGAPGLTVPDGSGNNSPFTAALLSQLQSPQQSVMQVFAGLAGSIEGNQEPWVKLDGSSKSLQAFMAYPFGDGPTVALTPPPAMPSSPKDSSKPTPAKPTTQPPTAQTSGLSVIGDLSYTISANGVLVAKKLDTDELVWSNDYGERVLQVLHASDQGLFVATGEWLGEYPADLKSIVPENGLINWQRSLAYTDLFDRNDPIGRLEAIRKRPLPITTSAEGGVLKIEGPDGTVAVQIKTGMTAPLF